MSFLLTDALTQEQVYTAKPLQLMASLNASALFFFRQQLERDIDAKTRSWNQIGFTKLELEAMLKLITTHPDGQSVEAHDNILLTHVERGLLAIYANRYLQLAIDSDDVIQRNVYGDALYNLMHGATQETQIDQLPLDLSYYGLHSVTRPLSALWDRFTALCGFRPHPEVYPFEPFTIS